MDIKQLRKVATVLLTALLIALPWLNPFAPGPSPAVLPLLLSYACAAALFVVWETARNPEQLGRLTGAAVWAWLIAGLLSSVMGLLQYFDAATVFHPWISTTSLGEAFANLRQRNQFATLTNIALAALIWLGRSGSASSRHANVCRWGFGIAAVALAAGNAASSSRTGLLQLVLIFILFSIWADRRHFAVRIVLVAAVVSYIASALALPWVAGLDLSVYGIAARLRAGDEICSSRLTLWSNVLHLIAQKPWLGWGWGELDYAHYITLYNSPRFCDILDNAHNLPLQLFVELGIPAGLLICSGFAWWVYKQGPWRDPDPTRQLAWSVMAVILLHSMLEYPLWYGPFQIAFGLCVVLIWWTRAHAEGATSIPPDGLLKRVLSLSAAAIFMASVAYAAWDYQRVRQVYLAPEARELAYREDALGKIKSSWLFADQVRFAELTLTPLAPGNAEWTFNTAMALLHYSPEPRIIEKVIESAVMLGLDQTALEHLARYRAAFPKEYASWARENFSMR